MDVDDPSRLVIEEDSPSSSNRNLEEADAEEKLKIVDEGEQNADELDVDLDAAEAECEAAIEKSLIRKMRFLELFKNAQKIRDCLEALREFMSDDEVLEKDRLEVQAMVESRINEEKAARKLEKEQKARGIVTANLANALRSATGIDIVTTVSSQLPPSTSEPPPAFPINVHVPPPTTIIANPAGFVPPVFNVPPPVVTATIVPTVTMEAPKKIAPISEDLLNYEKKKAQKVPPIPEALLPPEMRPRPKSPSPPPPKRRTLKLAGARPRRLWLRERDTNGATRDSGDEDDAAYTEIERMNVRLPYPTKIKKRTEDEKKELNKAMVNTLLEFKDEIVKQQKELAKQLKSEPLHGANASMAKLHRNSPLAVKRYHARQLVKETGMSLEEAMEEIEAQCREFPETEEPSRNDISRRHREVNDGGIPGIDRPPAGPPVSKRKRGGVKNRMKEKDRRRFDSRPPPSKRDRRPTYRDQSRWAPNDDYRYNEYDEYAGYSEGYPQYAEGYDEAYDASYQYQDQGYDDYYNQTGEYGADYNYSYSQDFSNDEPYEQTGYIGSFAASSSSEKPDESRAPRK
ncbi:unnamed protein product [Caenorhabditis bovis]|uniref:Uncharacterized protein n=1 Tax=Caenorhabditis bovis TaxID=2654633 RepID=A0A8S1EJX6_9PELO|nr:unnamed protein product [Caenorhabditis bovis]